MRHGVAHEEAEEPRDTVCWEIKGLEGQGNGRGICEPWKDISSWEWEALLITFQRVISNCG